MTSLNTLNEYLLQRVLFFLSNVPNFESAACCKIFHTILKDDDTWKYCKRKRMIDVSGNRGSAIKLHYMSNNNIDCNEKKRAALQSIKEHQGKPSHWDVKKNECDKEKNYFLKVLGVDGWKSLVMEFCKKLSFGPIKHILVRGNTLSVLCNLVQQYVIDTLEQAILLAVHRTSDSNEYPILKKVDILLVSVLAEEMTPGRKQLRIFSQTQPQFSSETVTTECRNKIVNHLSRMAGTTMLEYGTNELIWKKIMDITYALISLSCIRLYSFKPTFSVYAECSKDDIDLYNTPVPIRFRNNRTVATIVPRQIEDSANKLGLTCDRVYGSGWLLSEGRTLEEEMEAAKGDYFFKEGDTVFTKSEDETSTGSMSISDDNSCDDYSVYSDDKCPDF